MPDLDPAPVLDAMASDPRLRVFLANGRIETLPAKRSRRLLLLDQIAQAFEPGVRYPERRVSLFLGELHPDFAALRQYCPPDLARKFSSTRHRRSGGTVPSSPGDAG